MPVEFNLSLLLWKYLTSSVSLRCFSPNLVSSPTPSSKLIFSVSDHCSWSLQQKVHQICAICPPPSLNNGFLFFTSFYSQCIYRIFVCLCSLLMVTFLILISNFILICYCVIPMYSLLGICPSIPLICTISFWISIF